jgi:hypothetical protein
METYTVTINGAILYNRVTTEKSAIKAAKKAINLPKNPNIGQTVRLYKSMELIKSFPCN